MCVCACACECMCVCVSMHTYAHVCIHVYIDVFCSTRGLLKLESTSSFCCSVQWEIRNVPPPPTPHVLSHLQAERRQRSVGLGSKSLDYELTGVHTYMSAVKRMTAARWKMLEDQ